MKYAWSSCFADEQKLLPASEKQISSSLMFFVWNISKKSTFAKMLLQPPVNPDLSSAVVLFKKKDKTRWRLHFSICIDFPVRLSTTKPNEAVPQNVELSL